MFLREIWEKWYKKKKSCWWGLKDLVKLNGKEVYLERFMFKMNVIFFKRKMNMVYKENENYWESIYMYIV